MRAGGAPAAVPASSAASVATSAATPQILPSFILRPLSTAERPDRDIGRGAGALELRALDLGSRGGRVRDGLEYRALDTEALEHAVELDRAAVARAVAAG